MLKLPTLLPICCIVALGLALSASATKAGPETPKAPSATPAMQANSADAMRIQGEQRFRTNCGRCHAAPQKFPPRMMKTVLRHMRVRALITDEDMRLVLFYMTQ